MYLQENAAVATVQVTAPIIKNSICKLKSQVQNFCTWLFNEQKSTKAAVKKITSLKF